MNINFSELIFLCLYGLVKYLPTPVGDVFRYAVLKLFAPGVRTIWIHEGVTIRNPGGLRVGRGTSLNEYVFINGFGGVSIGERVAVGARCMFASFEHSFRGSGKSVFELPTENRPIVVEDDVYFGYGVIVRGGVTIGRGAVIGAGAVVTRDIPAGAVASGCPARVTGYRSEEFSPEKK